MPSRADSREATPFVWRSLPLRLALAAIPLWLAVSVLVSNVSWPTKLIVAVVLGVSLAAPGRGLLLTAALAPLGHLVAPFIGPGNFRISEAIVVAFLAGWALRALPDRRGPRVPLAVAGWLFAALAGVSVAGLAWRLHAFPDAMAATVDQLGYAYFLVVVDAIGVVEAARLLEGLALVAATVMLFRREPRLSVTLSAALTASASVAALSSVLLWRGIGSALALQQYRLIGPRVSAHVADVNASGSYFAMMVCLALGMAARARGRDRALWMAGAIATFAGLWLTRSQAALAALAIVVSLAAAWAATTRWTVRARGGALLALLAILLTVGYARARVLESDPNYKGVGFRGQFNESSLRMIAARPLFGVGVGQYYRMSTLFLSPQLGWAYGAENAHNYFLQMGGELGLAGFALFASWIGAAFARSARALARAPRDARLLGSAGGAMVCLITWLTGHPLLVGEVAYPFWMQFGLMTGLAGSTLLNGAALTGRSRTASATPRAWSLPGAAATAAMLISAAVMTAKGAVTPPESQAVDGLYGWETSEDGARFRWTGAYASLFVPADVTRVYLPVRLPRTGRAVGAIGVGVRIAGIDRGKTLVGDDNTWAIIDVPLPDAVAPSRFKRIDLKVDRVWQPAISIAGSADLRGVGVQVGEPRLLRE